MIRAFQSRSAPRNASHGALAFFIDASEAQSSFRRSKSVRDSHVMILSIVNMGVSASILKEYAAV